MEVEDQMKAALLALCARTPGGLAAVADLANLSEGNLQQFLAGRVHKKSGTRRGLGPMSRRHLEAAFPGWMEAVEGLPLPATQGVAQSMSDLRVTVVPTITWGELMADLLPKVFKLELPDNAMTPRAPAGSLIEFTRGIDPRPGDGVLVRDRDGNHYFREYRERRVGVWEAHATNAAYAPLDSSVDGLQMIAVLTGVATRWAQ